MAAGRDLGRMRGRRAPGGGGKMRAPGGGEGERGREWHEGG